MKRRELLLCCVALMSTGLIGCAQTPATYDATDSIRPGLTAYEWLLGDWRAEAGKNYVREQWDRSGPRSFSGLGSNENRTTGERKGYEQLELISRDGKVLFIATVQHNPAPVAFKLISDDPHQLVFSNPEHDFPKKIVYLHIDQDHYRVEVSDGGENGFALDFERMSE